jgi:hypothetical protein
MSKGMRLAITAAIALSSSVAAAQPAMTQPASGPHGEELSENTALAWSVGGTLGAYSAIGLAAATGSDGLATAGILGALVAPSFGHWYAGTWLTRGMGLRALGITTFVVGVLADNEGCGGLFYSGHGDPVPEDCSDNFRTTKGTALIFTGIAMFVGGTIDDVVTAPRRARRHNEHIQSLAVAPIVRGDGGGFAVSGRF